LALLLALVTMPSRAGAYSVLAHEAIIDATWQDHIVPTLKQRFPDVSEEALREARAYAYGGSLIQDLGYYPFGSHLFSNLVHYVRSGDFVEALLRESRQVNEYAFALGALAHHGSDDLGHPIAVNRAVPLLYPKLGQKYGAEVLFVDSPSRHVMTEFAFDVLEVARGAFKSDAYQDLIGFKVATPLLERAFRSTYGLDLHDLFGDTDLAIGSYRRAASRIIPDMTRLAWRDKRKEILEATPDVTEKDVVFTMTRQQYEQAFGTTYRKPGLFARFLVLLFKIVPKFGPLKPLAFTPLTPDTERMFVESFTASSARYRSSLRALRSGQLSLENADLDTGRAAKPGQNSLADKTYADLLAKLASQKFTDVPPALRQDINAHYAANARPPAATQKVSKQQREALRNLSALNAAAPTNH
jgi:hypothetical protein